MSMEIRGRFSPTLWNHRQSQVRPPSVRFYSSLTLSELKFAALTNAEIEMFCILMLFLLLVVLTNAEIEMMKERFSKLLLGEDMSGSGNGVCTALAISYAITN